MALQLRIISDHRRLLGDRSTVVFDAAGGSIGRAADNDWVLPDSQRFVSAHHARIHFRDGLFILEDTSTNGVFVNDDDHPVARRGAHVLQNGDIIRFGEYQVVAMIESRAAGPHPAPATDFGMPTTTGSVEVQTSANSVEVLAAFGQAAQTDLGAALDLDALLQADVEDFTGPLAVNAYGQPVTTPPPPAPRPYTPPAGRPPAASSAASDLSSVLAESDTERRAIARRIERLARAAARAQEGRTVVPPLPQDLNGGLAAFCKGAGIAADQFAPELQVRLLQLAGQLIREVLVGLKDMELVRGETLRPLQIGTAPETDDPRPSLAQAGVEELLVQILSQHESRRLDAVQWLREMMDRAKIHERAMIEALRAAFADFVARLAPSELESRFERQARGASDRGARNWELYQEFYRSIAAGGDGLLPRVFLDAFSAAYERALQPRGK